jgi:tetratricopeptide (TPR) repeat protein
MALDFFDARSAVAFGAALADEFSPRAASPSTGPALRELLNRATHETQVLKLNFYKKAKFANSFKWRMLENGVDKVVADQVTERLLMHLSIGGPGSEPARRSPIAPAQHSSSENSKHLLKQGSTYLAEGAFASAIETYQAFLQSHPHHPEALNNLGAAFCEVGRYQEAEKCFEQVISARPNNAEAHNNLGNVLRWAGRIDEAETLIRHALKLNPRYLDARVNLGTLLAFEGRTREARTYLKKALKFAPRNADVLHGLGHVAALEGRFKEAEELFARALKVNPKMPGAIAGMAGIRKMTPADAAWLAQAQQIAASGVAPLPEADLRFAIGKYYDDVGDFAQSFQNYKRANELLKKVAVPYDRTARSKFVDAIIGAFPSVASAQPGSSASTKPVFVVGMMRSGTTLSQQIIAAHPSVKAAGELSFWNVAMEAHKTAIEEGLFDESAREKLAKDYLSVLETACPDGERIVDKTPVNSDNLGLILSVFPNARIIYMQRDPLDTCLSCYFQRLSASMNFAMDLADLAHYYREHERLMAHWRAVLPAGSILEVPYADMLEDEDTWAKKMLEFIGLDWTGGRLEFQRADWAVATASFWQVRQRIYKSSVGRWRNYEKFIGPLLPLAR